MRNVGHRVHLIIDRLHEDDAEYFQRIGVADQVGTVAVETDQLFGVDYNVVPYRCWLFKNEVAFV